MNQAPLQSRVAVFNEVGQPLELIDRPIPRLNPGEVLVRITACTICGSDLHTYTGRRSSPLPIVLGHEIIGTVAAVRDDRTNQFSPNVSVDERVTWSIAASCGTCSRCSDDLPQKCESLFKYGHEEFNAYPLSGGLSQYCVLRPGTKIVPLADDLPDAVACPANCATATVAAAIRNAGDMHGRRVLITGAGMLGLTTCAFASAAGASDIVMCDVDESRLQRAAAFGATQLVDSVDTDADAVDYVFEMSGNPNAVGAAIQSAAIGGTVILVGSVSPSKSVPIDPERIVRRLLTIHGVHNYKPVDLVTAVEFLERHHQRFPFADLVEVSFTLDDAQAALEYAESARPIRVAVRP